MTEDLLKPRIKVIAPMPLMRNEVGSFLRYVDLDGPHFEIGFSNLNYVLSLTEIRKYPHLFHECFWWEERAESEMPEYIKFVKDYTSFKKGDVFKTCGNWSEDETSADIFFITDETSEYGKCGVPGGFNQCVPATKEEYEQYLLTQKSKP